MSLNRIVNLYLEFAELQALNRKPMTMHDWIAKLDKYLRLSEFSNTREESPMTKHCKKQSWNLKNTAQAYSTNIARRKRFRRGSEETTRQVTAQENHRTEKTGEEKLIPITLSFRPKGEIFLNCGPGKACLRTKCRQVHQPCTRS